MEILPGLFMFWLVYGDPATLLSLPFWIAGHKRARWVWWEFSILIIPPAVFLAMEFFGVKGGIGWSVFMGLIYLGCLAPVAAMIRVIVGQRVNRTLIAAGVLIGFCLVAVVLYLLLPMQGD